MNLTSASHTEEDGVHVKVTQDANDLSWKWHVYGLSKEADDFNVHEENYERPGYNLTVTFNGDPVEPDAEMPLVVEAPEAVLSGFHTSRITPQSVINGFYVGDNYVLLVSFPSGTTGAQASSFVLTAEEYGAVCSNQTYDASYYNEHGRLLIGEDGIRLLSTL